MIYFDLSEKGDVIDICLDSFLSSTNFKPFLYYKLLKSTELKSIMNHKNEFNKVYAFLEKEINSFKNPSQKISIMTQFQQAVSHMQKPETSSYSMIEDLLIIKTREQITSNQRINTQNNINNAKTKIEISFNEINKNWAQISEIVSSFNADEKKLNKEMQINIFAQLLYKTYDFK